MPDKKQNQFLKQEREFQIFLQLSFLNDLSKSKIGKKLST